MRYFCKKCGEKMLGRGYHCLPCKAKRLREWRAANPKLNQEMKMSDYRKKRNKALQRLGGVCSCCGEKRLSMLTIDHIYNNGYLDGKHRCHGTIKKVLTLPDPSQTLQILCSNCNTSKAVSGGVCEHRNERKVDRFVRFVSRLDNSLQATCLNFST